MPIQEYLAYLIENLNGGDIYDTQSTHLGK